MTADIVGPVIASVVGTVAAAIMTWALTVTIKDLRSRKKSRIEVDHEEAIKRDEDINMRYAILGRPATDWQPAQDGLLKIVGDLVRTMSEHRREDAGLFDDLHGNVEALRVSVVALTEMVNEHVAAHS